MFSRNDLFHSPARSREGRGASAGGQDAGFMLLELLLAMAVLAIAVGMILSSHRRQLDYDAQANERLRQQLAAENIGEHLAVVPYEEFPAAAETLVSQTDFEAVVVPFESESRSGWHVDLRQTTDRGVISYHVWSLEASQ